jgi:mannose-6-phosphate isomerase-like protein (cupin superfamily)
MPLKQGQAAFVPAGAEHRFTGYVGLSVLVVFARGREAASVVDRQREGHPV